MPDHEMLDLFAAAEGVESAETEDSDAGAAAEERTGAGEAAAAPVAPAGEATSEEVPLDRVAPPAPEPPPALTVTELNRAVRGVVEGAFDTLWVAGEVGNWKRAGSGHCYFTLKDESSEVRCVMWRTEASRLPMDPDNGMEVRIYADPTLYEARGSYQLRVRKLEAAGAEGLWRVAFERLRTRLQGEGLLDPARKRPIPRYPRTVGVVTSTTGAALRDILSVLGRRAPWTRVLVHNARVQGEGAAAEIAAGILRMGGRDDVDVLVVGRGGGSLEDLWAFNEEPVARAIAACPVPVVSAVGHEVDVTISDLVADLRAPTPSAAAEAVVPDGAVLSRQLGQLRLRMRRALQGSVEIRRRRLEAAPRRLAHAIQARTRPLAHRIEARRESLVRVLHRLLDDRRRRADVTDRLTRAVRVHMDRRKSELARVSGRLNALSPLATLQRGYAIPLSEEGRVLRKTGDFDRGAAFDLRVSDGRVQCRVEDTKPDDQE